MKQPLAMMVRQSIRERGYVLITSLVIGLVLLLLALTTISRSQGDGAIAASEILQARSAAISEAGAVTYQSLLLKYPVLAVYQDCENRGASGACNDGGSTKSWANSTSLIGASAGNCVPGNKLEPADVNTIATAAQTVWQNIDSNEPIAGQYRLVEYRYQPDDASKADSIPGTSTLQVEGRVSEETGRSAISRVALNFRVNSGPTREFAIGLVATDFTASGAKVEINANVCDASGTNASSDLIPYLGTVPDTGEPAQIVYTTDALLPPPAEGLTPLISSGTSNAVVTLNKLDLKKGESCQLPMLKDPKDCVSPGFVPDEGTGPVYRYNIISSKDAIKLGKDFPAGGALLTLGRTGTETIILYVEGNIKTEDSVIKITPGTKVILYHHDGKIEAKGKNTKTVFDTGGQPENFQIYAYDTTTAIDIDAGDNTQPTGAFIYAPNTEVRMKQGATIEGSIWAKRWDGKNGAILNQRVDDPGALKVNVPGPNRISPAKTWQREIDQPS